MDVVRAEQPQVALYPPGAVLSRRTLDDHELVWMLQGTATWLGPDGTSAQLRPGQLLLIPPDLPHSFVWDAAGTSAHGYVHFDVADVLPGPHGPIVAPMDVGGPAASLCAFLLEVGVRPPAARGALAAAVRVLLDLVLSPSGSDPGARPVPPAVARAVAQLRTAWSEMPLRRLPVAELAQACHLSPSQLTRVFVDWFGAAPATVLELARVTRAEQLLLRSDLTVAAIARACGFADAAHLTHRFRAVHGVPPGRFREGARSPVPSARSHRLTQLVGGLWSRPVPSVGAQDPR